MAINKVTMFKDLRLKEYTQEEATYIYYGLAGYIIQSIIQGNKKW